jgi:MSHA biogenesis protein MshP
MSTTRPDIRRQRGFSIVAAIFILVVLAGLAGYIVSTSSTQHLALAQDAMNSRALQASRAGIEWATHQVTRATAFQTACQAAAASYAGVTPATQAFPAGTLAGLEDFRVDVVCRSQSFTEGADTYRVYQVVSTACTAAACPTTAATGLGYVEHRQTATVRQ